MHAADSPIDGAPARPMLMTDAQDIGAGAPLRRVRIWDRPTRLFHWLLAVAFAAQWFTQDDARLLDLHVFAGYTIGALLLFRVAWGFAGTRYARFGSFAFGPRAALSHLHGTLAGTHRRFLGHNPAGAWSIFGLLALGAIAVMTGLATLGGAKQLGPLRGAIGYARGDTFAMIHKYVAWAMLALVVLHVLGVILASRAEHENLALSMVAGTKNAGASVASVPAAAVPATAMVLVLLAFAALYFRGYAGASPDRPYLPFTVPPLAQSTAWTKECGGCHLAYHPSILPARSWRALLNDQHDHFGEDLGLDDDTAQSLAAFAVPVSAESHATSLAWNVDRRTATTDVPLRVTDTAYWKRRHAGVLEADWVRVKRFACDGCHLDAAAGTFLPGAIRVGGAQRGAADGR